MNPELEIQEGIYNELSELLSKADRASTAGGFFAHYFQKKMHEGVIDLYDFSIKDMGVDGLQAIVEFTFQWNVSNICNMLVLPKDSLTKRFDRAMGVV